MYKYTLLREDSLPSTETVSLISMTKSTSTSGVNPTCPSASSAPCSTETPYACPTASLLSSSCPSSSSTQPLIPTSTAGPSRTSKGDCSSRPCISLPRNTLKSPLTISCPVLSSTPLLSGNPSPTLSVGQASRSPPATSSALPSTSKSAVSTLISLSTHTIIAPSGIPTIAYLGKSLKSPYLAKNKELLLEIRSCLVHDLISQVGQKRAHSLFKKHVQQNNYLVVYTDEERDRALGTELRRLLEESEDVVVAGPWNISLGELRLDGWRKLSEASRVVLVILSRALFSDKMLAICLPELLDNHRTVPLSLECLTSEDIPPHLTSILHRVGSKVYERNWNASNYVKYLQASYDFIEHLMCEIKSLENLLEEIKNNPSYICPCENC